MCIAVSSNTQNDNTLGTESVNASVGDNILESTGICDEVSIFNNKSL